MRELLKYLTGALTTVCPTYVHILPKTAFPFITLEPEVILNGLPWGPRIAILYVKIWSRYLGTMEILSLAQKVEEVLKTNITTSLSIQQSSLKTFKDGQTRIHTFKLKVRLKGATQ